MSYDERAQKKLIGTSTHSSGGSDTDLKKDSRGVNWQSRLY